MSKVHVDTETQTIWFNGHTYTGWENIRWLRAQLRVMELNATVLWGVEPSAAQMAAENTVVDAKDRFTVIKGDKHDQQT